MPNAKIEFSYTLESSESVNVTAIRVDGRVSIVSVRDRNGSDLLHLSDEEEDRIHAKAAAILNPPSVPVAPPPAYRPDHKARGYVRRSGRF